MAAVEAPFTRWKPRFFTLWISQALSLFGSALVQFALIWWLTSTTRSATVLAVASLVGLLPNVLLAPFAGAASSARAASAAPMPPPVPVAVVE